MRKVRIEKKRQSVLQITFPEPFRQAYQKLGTPAEYKADFGCSFDHVYPIKS